MVISILKNLSRRYSSHYLSNLQALYRFIIILTWILFHRIWFLVICILNLSIYCKFESIILFFISNKKSILVLYDDITLLL